MATMMQPFHETVAATLIALLHQRAAPWQKPLEPGQPGAWLPMNPVTGKRYRGINAICLMSQGHADPRWITYRQAASIGARVRQGEKGTAVQYWQFSEKRVRSDALGHPVRDAEGQPVEDVMRLERPRVFLATVFHASQVDALPPMRLHAAPGRPSLDRAEQILQASGAAICHASNSGAYYRPATDTIYLPDRSQFPSNASYYATALHELGHWTGHVSRLNRDLGHPFGSHGYAREELRAALVSLILGDVLGIGYDPGRHATYVGAWIQLLRNDSREIFRAAADAERIGQFVLGLEQALTLQHANAPTASADTEQGQQAVRRGAPTSHAGTALPEAVREDARVYQATERERQTSRVIAVEQPLAWERTYLAVPFEERHLAKAAGALWDKVAKCWYAGPHAAVAKLERWRLEKVMHRQNVAMQPRDAFAAAMRAHGLLVIGEHPIMDGRKHRIPVQGAKRGALDGFYIGYLDGHPAGRIINYKTGANVTWHSEGARASREQVAAMVAQARIKLATRDAARAQLQEHTAQCIDRQMAELIPLRQPTPYLQRKEIMPQPGVLTDSEGRTTYVPGIDIHGKTWTMQTIDEAGAKRFVKDSRKQGCFHVIGGMPALAYAPALVISEGYATAASVSRALGFATVAAFDAGNLVQVAKALQSAFPGKPVIIAGDDDRHLELTHGENRGRAKAQEAAAATGGALLLPVFAPGEGCYPPDLAPVTPETYREHLCTGSRLSQAQLAALDQMKCHTDFNDLAVTSLLGKDAINRQVRAFITQVIQKHHAAIEQPASYAERLARMPGVHSRR